MGGGENASCLHKMVCRSIALLDRDLSDRSYLNTTIVVIPPTRQGKSIPPKAVNTLSDIFAGILRYT